MEQGWVKLSRDIRNHWIWKDTPYSKGQAWMDLILSVNHKSKKVMIEGKSVTIKRGCTLTSIRSLGMNWGWSNGKVDRFLKCLEDDGMIERTRNGSGTLLTVINYSKFQGCGTENGTATERERNTDGTQTEQQRNGNGTRAETNKHEKNERMKEQKKVSKKESVPSFSAMICGYTENAALRTALEDYLTMRIKKRAAPTNRALELVLQKLDRLSGGDDAVKIAILEKSTMNNWTGVFELKQEEFPAATTEKFAN